MAVAVSAYLEHSEQTAAAAVSDSSSDSPSARGSKRRRAAAAGSEPLPASSASLWSAPLPQYEDRLYGAAAGGEEASVSASVSASASAQQAGFALGEVTVEPFRNFKAEFARGQLQQLPASAAGSDSCGLLPEPEADGRSRCCCCAEPPADLRLLGWSPPTRLLFFGSFEAALSAGEEQRRSVSAGGGGGQPRTGLLPAEALLLCLPLLWLLSASALPAVCLSLCLSWLLLNLQDVTVFSSHMLNRDVWSAECLRPLLEREYLLQQLSCSSADGCRYRRFYHPARFPHIAIIDPRTRQQMWRWEPSTDAHTPDCLPRAAALAAQLRAFLSKHSLTAAAAADSEAAPSRLSAALDRLKPVHLLNDEEQMLRGIADSEEEERRQAEGQQPQQLQRADSREEGEDGEEGEEGLPAAAHAVQLLSETEEGADDDGGSDGSVELWRERETATTAEADDDDDDDDAVRDEGQPVEALYVSGNEQKGASGGEAAGEAKAKVGRQLAEEVRSIRAVKTRLIAARRGSAQPAAQQLQQPQLRPLPASATAAVGSSFPSSSSSSSAVSGLASSLPPSPSPPAAVAAVLPAEPAFGPGVTRVQLRFPSASSGSGQRGSGLLQRRLRLDDSPAVLHRFIAQHWAQLQDVAAGIRHAPGFRVVALHPRRELNLLQAAAAAGCSIASLGLAAAHLVVEPAEHELTETGTGTLPSLLAEP